MSFFLLSFLTYSFNFYSSIVFAIAFTIMTIFQVAPIAMKVSIAANLLAAPSVAVTLPRNGVRACFNMTGRCNQRNNCECGNGQDSHYNLA
ncbi:hypothetical protein BKA57DRAFT_461761 [Linnemannia elongata]|nr:hypothetical protein BKA57DRAFT_461761 [Linnemannia elongata]